MNDALARFLTLWNVGGPTLAWDVTAGAISGAVVDYSQAKEEADKKSKMLWLLLLGAVILALALRK